MKATFCCFLLIVLQIVMSWESVVVARRPFPSSDGMSHSGPKEAQRVTVSSPPNAVESEKGLMSSEVKADVMGEAHYRGVSKIGSNPPSCKHKCYSCAPCEAIQVPSTSSKDSHLSLQYANYEPESWKCKCGPSLYTP